MIDHWRHNNEESKAMLGQYKLDLAQCKFHNNGLKSNGDLILIVSDDHTFKFSRSIPFFSSMSGKWAFDDDGDLAVTECKFDKTNEWFQIPDGFETWTFQGYNLKNARDTDLIVFKKI